MEIVIGSDHGGFTLKNTIVELLGELGYQVKDVGCFSDQSVDYPDFAEQVSKNIIDGENNLGILVCGTGIGMSIAANRHREIRAAVCFDEFTAKMSREHNNANILCLGERVIDPEVAKQMVRVWLETEFDDGGRHQRRIAKFSQ